MTNQTFTTVHLNAKTAQSYFLLDKVNEALEDFDKVLELDPYNEKAYFMRGSIHEFFGDLESALENYQEATRLAPEFYEAKQAVGEMNKKLGKR